MSFGPNWGLAFLIMNMGCKTADTLLKAQGHGILKISKFIGLGQCMGQNQLKGMTLIELLMAMGLIAISVAAGGAIIKHATLMSREIDNRKVAVQIQQRLLSHTSCELTLGSYDRSSLVPGTRITLKSATNAPLVNMERPAPASSALVGGYQYQGPWYIISMWNGDGLDVFLGKLDSSNSEVAKSPLTGQLLDYSHPSHILFSSTSMSLCSGQSVSSFYHSNLLVRSGELIDLMGWNIPPNRRTVRELLRYPMHLELGCNKWCQTQNYRAGWPREFTDFYHEFDNNGSFIRVREYPNGQGRIICGCLR